MSKWRKKPVVIDADIYKQGMEDGWLCNHGGQCAKDDDYPNNVTSWNEKCGTIGVFNVFCYGCKFYLPVIKTLEGHHIVSDGDYVITGVKGEKYPCKPDIFAMTYEPV